MVRLESGRTHVPTQIYANGRRAAGPRRLDLGAATVYELADELLALVQQLHQCDGPEAMSTAVLAAAMAMTRADAGSIRLVTGRRRCSQTRTSALSGQLDAIQERVQQGPCLDAIADQRPVRVDDLDTDDRWPLFSRQARGLGTASVLSVPLIGDGADLGVLSLYSPRIAAFPDPSEHVGSLIAAHAAVAYAAARRVAQLEEAVLSRDLIGQAKGILSERFTIDGDTAFRVLVQVSQHTNRKLHEVAAELVQQGTIAPRRSPSSAAQA